MSTNHFVLYLSLSICLGCKLRKHTKFESIHRNRKRKRTMGSRLLMLCCVLSLTVVVLPMGGNNEYEYENAAAGSAPSPSPSGGAADNHRKVTEIVDKVCKKTSNYKNCVDTLYSDPRTADADRYTLAYVSFGLAYANAVQTRDRIADELLLHKNDSASRREIRQNLQICERDYNKTVKYLESALNDLNSETFFTLPGYANHTARLADDCQAHYPAFTSASLNSICQICTLIIVNLFNGGGSP